MYDGEFECAQLAPLLGPSWDQARCIRAMCAHMDGLALDVTWAH